MNIAHPYATFVSDVLFTHGLPPAPRPPDSYKMVDIFRMYDVDDSGCINLQEMTNIISTMDELEGEEKASFHI